MIDPEALIEGEIEIWKRKVRYRAKELVKVASKHGLQPSAKFAAQLAKDASSRKFQEKYGTELIRQALSSLSRRDAEEVWKAVARLERGWGYLRSLERRLGRFQESKQSGRQ
jgi:hypothetical protein